MMLISYGAMLACNLLMIALASPLIGFYNTTEQTAKIAWQLVFIHSAMGIIFWPASFTLPNALRAAGDARFTMIVSVASMWICRIGLSYVLGTMLHMQVLGVWIAMTIDWVFRIIFFVIRICGNRWKKKAMTPNVS